MKKSLDIKIYYDFLIKIGQNYQSELKDLDDLRSGTLVERIMYAKKMKDFRLREEDVILYNNITSKFKVRYNGELQDLSSLNNDEILLLFTGFLIIENVGLYNGGSVSAGIQIYQHIAKRLKHNYSQIKKFTDWTLTLARNRYVPFGTNR
jgi:hypothetical protein